MLTTLFTIRSIVDILLVGFIFYGVFRLLRRSGIINLFWGILAFVIAWYLVRYVFHLELTTAIFDQIMGVGAIALIVIFQTEIRTFVYRLGSRFNRWRFANRLRKGKIDESTQNNIREIILACQHMSESKTGALIVFTGTQHLTEYADTGEQLDAQISARLIENIFFKNTPLHDGALIITKGRLDSAACILPVSQNQNVPQHYGLRHRAALGITEKTDATAIIVSEETGLISIAKDNTIESVKISELYDKLLNNYTL
ncbi:MAG: diadenylate cyclase CdaA [Paludibacteraceae bacterium]|nr:diadenylate cyclase CdaA [Paludibacteraceae bacterium]